MRRIILFQIFITFLFFSCTNVKIALPEIIIENGIVYSVGPNYINAYTIDSNKLLWNTILYKTYKPFIYNPFVEHDMQLNIIVEFKIIDDYIEIRTIKNNMYYVNKYTGQIIKKENK